MLLLHVGLRGRMICYYWRPKKRKIGGNKSKMILVYYFYILTGPLCNVHLPKTYIINTIGTPGARTYKNRTSSKRVFDTGNHWWFSHRLVKSLRLPASMTFVCLLERWELCMYVCMVCIPRNHGLVWTFKDAFGGLPRRRPWGGGDFLWLCMITLKKKIC